MATKKRQVILDTETTGLSPSQGHRLIEVGCLEMVNRRITDRTFHQYINPERKVDAGAIKVHGITNEFLADKPLFADIADELFEYLEGAELIIHNAPFDMGFLDAEFARYQKRYVPLEKHCQVFDTLVMARQKHPGAQNSLDALCRRYGIDNKHRDLHGALLDAKLLSQVYLHMTGGQSQLFAAESSDQAVVATSNKSSKLTRSGALPVIQAAQDELAAHEAFVAAYLQSNS